MGCRGEKVSMAMMLNAESETLEVGTQNPDDVHQQQSAPTCP